MFFWACRRPSFVPKWLYADAQATYTMSVMDVFLLRTSAICAHLRKRSKFASKSEILTRRTQYLISSATSRYYYIKKYKRIKCVTKHNAHDLPGCLKIALLKIRMASMRSPWITWWYADNVTTWWPYSWWSSYGFNSFSTKEVRLKSSCRIPNAAVAKKPAMVGGSICIHWNSRVLTASAPWKM